MTVLGTHNLHDEAGKPTGFAAVLIFTEAIPDEVYDALSKDYVINVCRWQKDLIICWRKDLDVVDLGSGYRFAHVGIRKVSPKRGTFIKKIRLNGKRTKVLAHHRINAAFPPYVRGEGLLRRTLWRRHTAMDIRIAKRAIKQGWEVLAGGDPNVPGPDVKAWGGVLHEVGRGFDRLAASKPLRNFEVVPGKAGSDHYRQRAEVNL